MEKRNLIRLIFFFISFYAFLLSIKLMGHALKGMGSGFAETIIRTTSNPFIAVFIGILATSIVQSSSFTTSMVVGMVAVGTIPIRGAIPIIMGANIGTTVTNTIVSLAHITRKQEFQRAFAGATVHDFFNWLSVIVLFPLEIRFHIIEKIVVSMSTFFMGSEGISTKSPLDYLFKPVIDVIDQTHVTILIFALILLFLSLTYMVKMMRKMILVKLENFLHNFLFRNDYTSFFVGLMFTAMIQSSSVTTSLIIPLIGAGVLTLKQIFPYTLGANVGTTVTALLASLVTNSQAAVTIAFSHLTFNLLGICIFYPLKRIPLGIATSFAKLTVKSKYLAIILIAGLFYLLPLIFIMVSRWL